MTKKRDVVHGRVPWVDAFADAEIFRLTGGDTKNYRILIYYPALTTNPYQSLLYSQALCCGYIPLPTPDLAALSALRAAKNVVLHIHWLGAVLRAAKNEHEAIARLKEFELLVDSLVTQGIRIVWTIHNILPHDTAFRQCEIRLRQILADRAVAIHVMNRQTRRIAKDIYDIPPSKIFYIPHPSYEGWYPRVSERATSRLELGISFSSHVFLCFGAILPYKGLEYVISAFRQEFGLRDDVMLLIAGPAPDKAFLSKILEASGFDRRIIIEPSRIAEYDVQHYFCSADFVVVANIDLLNSGVIALATTFEVPVIARANLGAGSITGGLGIAIADISIESLRIGFRQAMQSERGQYDFSKIARTLKPAKISSAFFEKLSGMMDG